MRVNHALEVQGIEEDNLGLHWRNIIEILVIIIL